MQSNQSALSFETEKWQILYVHDFDLFGIMFLLHSNLSVIN